MSCGVMVSGMGAMALGEVAHDQKGICGSAAQAIARNSPAAQGLFNTCTELRQANIGAGVFQTDGMSSDDGWIRVALTDAGEAVIARSAALQAALAAQPVSRQRGFKMGTAVRLGKTDPGYLAFMGPALSHDAELAAGFRAGLTPPDLTKGAAGSGDDDKILGMPAPVAIGVGVGVLGALGFVAYKYLR